MKAKIIEKFQCPRCEGWLDSESSARGCCAISSEYFCSVCNESFWQRRQAEAHIKTPHVGVDTLTPFEIYKERLLFGNPPLGEWEVTLEMENEIGAFVK